MHTHTKLSLDCVYMINEYNCLPLFKRYKRKQFLNMIYRHSLTEKRYGYWRPLKNIPRLKKDTPVVIGTKRGGGIASTIKKNLKLLKEFEKFIKLPIKYICLYRNPYDMITTGVKIGLKRFPRKEI